MNSWCGVMNVDLFYVPAGQIYAVLSHASEDPEEALAYRDNMPTKKMKKKKPCPHGWIPG